MRKTSDNNVSNLFSAAGAINEDHAVEIEVDNCRTKEDLELNRPGDALRRKILDLPESPGVYMYLDKNGKVIYVGKAKRLKRRVSSYFNRHHDSLKTNLLVRAIRDLRFIVVASEEDALHLENAMIKEYQPHYNILLKDDKSYPWIVITNELYPRVFMTRNRDEKGKYYGPYSNLSAAKTVLQLIRDIFPVRSCRHNITEQYVARGKGRLCLDYHIHKCGGPCVGKVSPEEYAASIRKIRQILNGETGSLLKILRDEMECLSSKLKFEQAQEVKEKYDQVLKYRVKTQIVSDFTEEVDIFAYDETDKEAYVHFMHIRNGAVVQSLNLEYRHRGEETKDEILSMAIAEIGHRFERSFSEIIVPFQPDTSLKGVSVIIPQKGDRKRMLDVAMKNVMQYKLDRRKQIEAVDPERGISRLMQIMQKDFRLKTEPRHIECFDNSNIQGSDPVASCVVFRNGKPSRKEYRHFNIKTVVGADDFASMKEVLHRRYTRLMAEGEELPQLVIVDGGKGQLNAAVEAFDEMGLRGVVALAGIAKRLEEIYFPGDHFPLYIDKKSESLRVVQALRDEAHRFGITHHRNRRSKSQIVSELDSIKGVGPKTVQTLMRVFKSVKRLRQASEDEIATLIGPAKARIIVTALQSSSSSV